MLYRTPVLDDLETAVCARIEHLRARLDRATIREWRHPLWAGRLWRLMLSHVAATARQGALNHDSCELALAAAASAQTADAAYRRGMTLALQMARDPSFRFSIAILKQLHSAIAQSRRAGLPGRLRRTGVTVTHEATGERWYTAPPHEDVPALLAALIDELNESSDAPAPVRAAMAHLQLALIHPFDDANGRTARCLQTLVLARAGYRSSAFCSLDFYFGRRTQHLNDVLAAVSGGSWQPEHETRAWVRFCLAGHLWQARHVEHRVQGLTALGDALEQMLANAQVSPRLMPLLLDAALGQRVTACDGNDADDVCRLLAAEHLDAAVDAGLLNASDDDGGRAYVASRALVELRRSLIREQREDENEDPFASHDVDAASVAARPTAAFWTA